MPLNALRMTKLRKHTQHGYWTRPAFNPPDGLWIAGTNYTSTLVVDTPRIRNTAHPQTGVFDFRLEAAVPEGYASAITVDHPAAWWRLNDGGTVATDSSGNGRDATVVGSVRRKIPGVGVDGDAAMRFDDITQYILSTYTPASTGALSYEAWVNHGGVPWSTSFGEILFCSKGTGNYMAVVSGSLFMSVVLGGVQRTASFSAVPTSGWHHICATWDGTTMQGYVDGVAGTPSVPVGGASGFTQALVLAAFDTTTFWYTGGIDEAAFYDDRALTPTRIAAHYAAGLASLRSITAEQEVTFSRAGVQYAGRVRTITPDDLRPTALGLDVECQDFTSLLDDAICTSARSVVETDAQRISWLLRSFDRRGITAYNVQTLYPAMPTQDFTGMTLTDALKAVLKYGGGKFYVDFAKDLHTFVNETLTSPFGLSDAPNNITTFPFGEFDYPNDSVDLRNAVYVVGKAPPSPNTISEIVTADGGVSDIPLAWAIFTAIPDQIAALAAAGPFTTGTNTLVNPPFGRSTVAGNLLTAWVESDSIGASTASPGWLQAGSSTNGHGPWVTLFYKPNCAAGEAAPSFTSTGVAPMKAQLGEFTGIQTSSPLRLTGGQDATRNQVNLPATNTGDLLIFASSVLLLIASTATFTEATPGAVVSRIGDDGSVNQINHAAHSYAFMGPLSSWYTNDTSIALYGRREAAITDEIVNTQAALDALAATYLAANASPHREASCRVWQVGLAAGQIVPVTNALHGLVAQPFRIQGVETTFSENSPVFKVQFADSTIDLASQMSGIRDQIAKLQS